MKAIKIETNKKLTTYFYKYNSLEFEIDTMDKKLFTIGKVNNNYWLNVVDNTPTKTKQTLINRLMKGLFD